MRHAPHPPHEGQNPRRLQEKANSFSWAQLVQRGRKNLWARMPRNASNSSLTKSGNPEPASVSTCAKKVPCALAPADTGWFLPVGAVHCGADFQPLRVELAGAGSFGEIGRGGWPST